MNSRIVPFVDDKLKRLMREELRTSFIAYGTKHTNKCTCATNSTIIEFNYQPNTS
jgi:hypothetical protein